MLDDETGAQTQHLWLRTKSNTKYLPKMQTLHNHLVSSSWHSCDSAQNVSFPIFVPGEPLAADLITANTQRYSLFFIVKCWISFIKLISNEELSWYSSVTEEKIPIFKLLFMPLHIHTSVYIFHSPFIVFQRERGRDVRQKRMLPFLWNSLMVSVTS